MTAQGKGLSTRVAQLLTGGLIGTLVGLIGTLLTTYMVVQWDKERERRGALHTLVVSWHGAYLGNHRDSISEWLLTPDGVALRDLPRAEYGPALFEAFNDNRAPATAILAIAGFFRTIDICIDDERCDSEQTLSEFAQTALDYHDLFGPLLRYLDCNKNYPDTEVPVLRTAKKRRDVLSGPERCKETLG